MNRLNLISKLRKIHVIGLFHRWMMLLVMCFFYVGAAEASTLKDLFEVGVPVLSQGEGERAEASKKAFEILLVRITGRRDLPETESGQQMIENARQYVSSFRYEAYEAKAFENSGFSEEEKIESTVDSDADNATSGEDVITTQGGMEGETKGDTEEDNEALDEPEVETLPTQKLVVSFDEKAVKGGLWKQKLPVWGKTRPSTLLWIAVQDANQRVLLDVNESSAILAYLEAEAKKRGVPLLFPLLDLEDQMKINVTDIWGGFKEPIQQASARYQPEAILSARLFLDPFGEWQARWTLLQGGDEFDWQVTASDLNAVIIAGIDQLADKLALRYAHISTSQDDGEFSIYVSDVKKLSDFVKVNKYLASLSSIKRAEVTRVKGDELVYRLDLRSSPDALKQAIKLGKVLLSTEDPFAPTIENTNHMAYRLMP